MAANLSDFTEEQLCLMDEAVRCLTTELLDEAKNMIYKGKTNNANRRYDQCEDLSTIRVQILNALNEVREREKTANN